MGEETSPKHPLNPEEAEIFLEASKIKEEIVKRFGPAEYNRHKPSNVSAEKLTQLRKLTNVNMLKRLTLKQLQAFGKKAIEDAPIFSFEVDIPEELTLAFTEEERKMIGSYFSRPFTKVSEVSKDCGLPEAQVLRFLNSKEFQIVKAQILKKLKDSLPYEALIAIQSCIRSKEISNQKLNASMAVLEDAGIIKGKAGLEVNIYNEFVDPQAEEELRKLGDKLANLPNASQN